MTKQEEFITKTLMPYFTGEEAFSVDDNGYCVCNGPNGTYCAFAKCVKNPESLEEDGNASGILKMGGFSVLTDEALGMGFTTTHWNAIQGIHDRKGLRCHDFEVLSEYGPLTELRKAIDVYHKKEK
jgi:hypothetical protein